MAVVGGGPAGMEAALTAAGRSHDVTLYEKSDALGGTLKFADYVSFKYPLRNFKDYLVYQVEKSAVRVKLRTEATPDMLKEEGYAEIIVAIGAQPIVPPIPGLTGNNVVLATEGYGKEKDLGNRIVVIGGGQVGCETALHLAKGGKQVTIIEMLPELAPDASTMHRTELPLELDKEPGLKYITGAEGTMVTESSVVYVAGADAREVEADTVVVAVGMKARSAEAEKFSAAGARLTAIGDCVRARIVENAVKEAFYAAVRI